MSTPGTCEDKDYADAQNLKMAAAVFTNGIITHS